MASRRVQFEGHYDSQFTGGEDICSTNIILDFNSMTKTHYFIQIGRQRLKYYEATAKKFGLATDLFVS